MFYDLMERYVRPWLQSMRESEPYERPYRAVRSAEIDFQTLRALSHRALSDAFQISSRACRSHLYSHIMRRHWSAAFDETTWDSTPPPQQDSDDPEESDDDSAGEMTPPPPLFEADASDGAEDSRDDYV